MAHSRDFQKYLRAILSVLSRRNACHPGEKPAEGGRVGEVQTVCNLRNACAGEFEQHLGLSHQKIIDVVDHGSARQFPYDPGQVDGRNTDRIGIKGDVMMLCEIRRQ